MAWPMPQPGQCPRPSSVDKQKEGPGLLSGKKNKKVNAVIQHNSSRLLRNHLRTFIVDIFFQHTRKTWQAGMFYFPKAPILLLNIFTAIAISITPKNFLTANNPTGPNNRSINCKDLKTRYTTTRLIRMPNKI